MSTATTTVDVTNAFALLAHYHPQHAERIANRGAQQQPGSIVTIEHTSDPLTRTDCGTFYTGIRFGDHVVVSSMSEFTSPGGVYHASRSAQRIDPDQPGSHLSVNGSMVLVPVDPSEWTLDEARMAQVAAERFADDERKRAVKVATGLGNYDHVADDAQEQAMIALQNSAQATRYAFAVGVLVNCFRAATSAQRDPIAKRNYEAGITKGMYVI